MTSIYIYIEAGRVIDDSTKFFKVEVGTGRQSNRDYLFMLGFAVSRNYYFEKQSRETDEFLYKIAQSLGTYPTPLTLEALNIQHVRVRDLVRAIKKSEKAAAKPIVRNNIEHQRDFLDSNYFFHKNLGMKFDPAKRETY